MRAAAFAIALLAASAAWAQPQPEQAPPAEPTPRPAPAAPAPPTAGDGARATNAASIHEAFCRGGNAVECDAAARMYRRGEGDVPKDPARALQLYDRGCALRLASSCNAAGELYEKGEGVAKDEAKAKEYYARAIAQLDQQYRVRRSVYFGVIGGANLSPEKLGWQGGVVAIGDAKSGLMSLHSLVYEELGAVASGSGAPTARVKALTLTPVSLYVGADVLRLGLGFDVAYGLGQSGDTSYDAKGFSVGGSAGGGLAFVGERFDLVVLGRYRIVSGPRLGGVFVDAALAFKPWED